MPIADAKAMEGLDIVHHVILSAKTTRPINFDLSLDDISATNADYDKVGLTFSIGTTATLGANYEQSTNVLTVPAGIDYFGLNEKYGCLNYHFFL